MQEKMFLAYNIKPLATSSNSRLIFVLLLCLITAAGSVQGQILHVDKRLMLKDTSNLWIGNLSGRLNVNNRNSTAEEQLTFVGLHGTADVGYLTKHHGYSLLNSLNYFTTGAGPFVSTGHVHFRANWMRRQKWSFESFTQVQYDRSRNLQRRFLVGSGLLYNLYQSKKSYFHIGSGVMYESEMWQQPEGDPVQINLWKSTSYIGTHMDWGENVVFAFVGYYQIGYSDLFEQFLSRVSGKMNLEIKISDKLVYTTSFELQYESRPIIPINNVVYMLTNGIRVRIGKLE